MTTIDEIYENLRRDADADADPSGGYARGLRAASDRLRPLLAPSSPASAPVVAQDDKPAESEPEPAAKPSRPWRPPVGAFKGNK